MARILLVEDDSKLMTAVKDLIVFENHQLETASNGRDGYEMMQARSFDLVVLDWDLPLMSGIDILREFRGAGGTTPILMLTGKSAAEEKELALDSGADDYVCKPFNVKEFRARIRALLRRPPQLVEEVLRVEGISLDPRTFIATLDNKDMRLTAREFSLLEFLMRNSNQVFSLDAFIERLWPSADECSEDAVRMAIKRLRQKLGNKGSFIQTVYGSGYMFSAKKD
jgi:DNA-binding response OmpR family regulator